MLELFALVNLKDDPECAKHISRIYKNIIKREFNLTSKGEWVEKMKIKLITLSKFHTKRKHEAAGRSHVDMTSNMYSEPSLFPLMTIIKNVETYNIMRLQNIKNLIVKVKNSQLVHDPINDHSQTWLLSFLISEKIQLGFHF
jgi:hypothetical protein